MKQAMTVFLGLGCYILVVVIIDRSGLEFDYPDSVFTQDDDIRSYTVLVVKIPQDLFKDDRQ